MLNAVQMLGVGGLLVALVACGSHPIRDHRSTDPASLKTVNARPVHGSVKVMDLASDHQGWMMTDQLNDRGYVTSATLYHTMDWGKQWKAVARYPRKDSAVRRVESLVFTSPDQGMALAGRGVAAGHTKYQLLRTTNGGRTWHPTATIWMPSGPTALAFWNATHGMIVGGPGGGLHEAAAVTQNGGRRWTSISLPGPSPSRIGASLSATALAFASSRDGFVLNAYWRMNARGQTVPNLQELLTGTGGKTWRTVSVPTHGLVGTVTALSFSSPTTGWVALYTAKNNHTVIESTTDRGRRWRDLRLGRTPLAGELGVLDQANARMGCFAALQNDVRCTVDGGRSWYLPNA